MLLACASVIVFTLGTFHSAGHITRSTYFCLEPVDSWNWVIFLQLLGLGLDAVITVLLWRILAWNRTMKLRLRTLGSALILSAISMGFLWLGAAIFEGNSHFKVSFGSLYAFDIMVDSVAFGGMVMCAATWICETSPLLPVSAVTILVGVWSSVINAMDYGTWLHVYRKDSIVPAWTVMIGAVFFLYFHEVKRVFFAGRALLSTLLVLLTIILTFKVWLKKPIDYPRHPISDLIFKANTAHDRWRSEAAISQFAKVAADTYMERHEGRSPPPNFDSWFEFAKGTAVIDTFEQIDSDLLAFADIRPDVLRKKAEAMAQLPGVAAIFIQDGKASHREIEDDTRNADLKDLVGLISDFSAHLPDMVIPINLEPTPRILPSWEHAHSHYSAEFGGLGDLITKRSSISTVNQTEPTLDWRDEHLPGQAQAFPFVSAADYRDMIIDGCSPSSPARRWPVWNHGEFCVDCIRRHSKDAFLYEWDKAMEVCEQPDLKNLHEIFTTAPGIPPVRALMPLFSLTKTDFFSDILIPLPRGTTKYRPDMKWTFERRYDSLFWRGAVGPQDTQPHNLRSSQKYRLLHLFNNPGPRDEVTLLLPDPTRKKALSYERTSAEQANRVAPFDIGIGGYSDCHGEHCDLVRQIFGTKEEVQEPLEYRYVLLLDNENSPPADFIRTVRSGSVPFVSTIFRSWYTERLQPYLHFVPIDPRYHSLHSTYLYFTGTENRAKINGRDTNMRGRYDDGEWIAKEGRKWADKALGARDMGVYLFRLLLEWGRLIDDDRDNIGFRKNDKGGFDNIGWTKRSETS